MSDRISGSDNFEAFKTALELLHIDFTESQLLETVPRFTRCCGRCEGHVQHYPLRVLRFTDHYGCECEAREVKEVRVEDREGVQPHHVLGVRVTAWGPPDDYDYEDYDDDL